MVLVAQPKRVAVRSSSLLQYIDVNFSMIFLPLLQKFERVMHFLVLLLHHIPPPPPPPFFFSSVGLSCWSLFEWRWENHVALRTQVSDALRRKAVSRSEEIFSCIFVWFDIPSIHSLRGRCDLCVHTFLNLSLEWKFFFFMPRLIRKCDWEAFVKSVCSEAGCTEW